MSVEVHIEWAGETHLVGRIHTAQRSPAMTFEYVPEWLGRADAFAIDPTSLPLRAGPHHRSPLFGAMQDCGPDRWGRLLIDRAVRKRVLESRPYQDLDYVLALDDSSRIGALRFRADADGPFLASGHGNIPPIIQLAALLNATDAVHDETETATDLRYLLAQGSPLGGARPKSAIALGDGQLAIAKFPKPDDTRDIAAGEILALTLAQQAGITVAGHRLVDVKGQTVSVITRFDREGARRIPFLSANSLLGLSQGEPGAYTMLADGIRQFGHDATADLHELWCRLIFSLLASLRRESRAANRPHANAQNSYFRGYGRAHHRRCARRRPPFWTQDQGRQSHPRRSHSRRLRLAQNWQTTPHQSLHA